jgi:hypothetical protein
VTAIFLAVRSTVFKDEFEVKVDVNFLLEKLFENSQVS